MEYIIEELTRKGKILHPSVFSKQEADAEAARIRKQTGNPVTYHTKFVESNQIEDSFQFKPITAQELFVEVKGEVGEFEEQSFRTKLLFQLLAETANNVLDEYQEYQHGIIIGGSVEGVN